MKIPNNCDLIIKTKIWENEQYELIDYDNKNTIKKVLKINSSGFISRVNNNIIFSNIKNDFNQLLEIKKNEENHKYSINCGNWSNDLKTLSSQEGAYILYKTEYFKEQKSIKNKYYKLSQGDIIKLGRIYIKLLDMQLEDEINNEIDEDNNGKNNDNERNTMIRNSSFNSSIIKVQEVIKGTFIHNRKNQNELLLSNDNIYNNKNNKSEQNKLNIISNSKIDDSSNKNIFFLTRVKSSEELFLIKPKINLNINNNKNILFNKNNQKPKINACRICYGENSIEENPLICPCTCKGSMKFIHFLCLKNWLNSKIESELNLNSERKTTISYNKKDIYCELCNTQYPDYIRYKGKLYNISFYKPNFKEFIMFETLRIDKKISEFINIVSLDNKNMIHIGRSRECDFSIPEISISRFHSTIQKDKGELFIEDNKSKFGTLILVQNDNIEIINNTPLKLQINNTYIKIKMNLPLLYSCCNVNTNTIGVEKLDYQDQNKKFLNIFSCLNCLDIKDNNNINLNSDDNYDEDRNDLINSNNKLIQLNNNNDIFNENNKNEKDNSLKVDENNKNNFINNEESSQTNNNIDLINNMEIYKRNIPNNLKNYELDNNYNNNSKNVDLSNYNTSIINNKKNSINLIIEDCNHKYISKNIKLKKKIKITKNQNNSNNDNQLEHNLKLSQNIANFYSIKNKINTINLIDTNCNNNIFNINKVKPKIKINKNKFINSLFNSSKKTTTINKNNNILEEQSELMKNFKENDYIKMGESNKK